MWGGGGKMWETQHRTLRAPKICASVADSWRPFRLERELRGKSTQQRGSRERVWGSKVKAVVIIVIS